MNKLSLIQGRINPHPGHVVASLDKTSGEIGKLEVPELSGLQRAK